MAQTLPKIAFWSVLAFGTLVMLLDLMLGGRWPLAESGGLAVWDFATIWAAAERTLQGEAALVYDHAAHDLYYAELLGQPPEDILAFGYPPSALIVFWPLGLLPYGTAMLCFLLFGLAAWFLALKGITQDSLMAVGMALAFGGATQTIILGQSGFLTAALISGGLLLLPKRPNTAGILFGLLALKPHLALASWMLMAMTRRWQALAVACLVQGLLAIAATVLFGWQIWPTYLKAAASLSGSVADRPHDVVQYMMQSPLALAVHWGGQAQAVAFHLVTSAAAIAAFLYILRSNPRMETSAAATIALTMMLTPYSFLYDATMLVAAAAFLLAGDRKAGQTSVVLIAVLLPSLWYLTRVPFSPLAAALLLVICIAEVRDIKREKLLSA